MTHFILERIPARDGERTGDWTDATRTPEPVGRFPDRDTAWAYYYGLPESKRIAGGWWHRLREEGK